jgi:hypothetical protein
VSSFVSNQPKQIPTAKFKTTLIKALKTISLNTGKQITYTKNQNVREKGTKKAPAGASLTNGY